MASECFEFGPCYSSSSSGPKLNYDVFLSFRGDDTRRNFTDHLYAALTQAGIYAYRDDNELPRGEEISPELSKAIEGSRISIVVFSKGYASSRWCLGELVNILKCRHKIGQVVLPVFYDIDPADVRKQTGNYAKAFHEHEERYKEKMEKVGEWREALAEAGKLSGWHLKIVANGYESEFIKTIVSDVACKLGSKTLHVAKHPVGICSRVHSIISLLRGARSDVRIVGIHGIAGIGKTTVAKAVFNALYFGFEGSCFLLDVKEISRKPNGPVELQERLLDDILKPKVGKVNNVYEGMNLIKERLHRKRVLVVLDDVDGRDQLDTLMGERSWFGAGSVIIIVTKSKDLLTQLDVDGRFHAKELDPPQSLQLFSWHAFRKASPVKDFEELSAKVVDYCKGLPLALQILGSHLFKRDKDEWEIDIVQWQKIPHNDIQGKLKISFEALNADIKEIFLDIACFFVGGEKEYVAKILDARYDYNPEVAFRTLIGGSLITFDSWNMLRMHDILRNMGREIVRQMSPHQPGKCSRIWHHKDAYDVLYSETGTDAVQGLALNVRGPTAISLSTKSFTNMRHLKLLQIFGARVAGSYVLLPKELIWLCWFVYPLTSLPSDLQLNDLVVLDMQKSNIQKLWKGTKILNKLKILNLSYSNSLSELPNFLGLSSLERLILINCTSLVVVHQSIGHLKSLVLLNLEGCYRLKSLPESMGNLKSLETLNITRCAQLEKLPERLGDVESLTELFTNGTAIKQLPTSARYLKNLKKLSLGGHQYKPDLQSKSWFSRFSTWLSPESCCNLIAELPASFTSLSSLKELDLRYCGLSEAAASSIDLGSLSFLEILNLSGNKFVNLPPSIACLPKLQVLNVERCSSLLSISELPSTVQVLFVKNCTSIERVRIPVQLERLPLVDVEGCKSLIEVQGMACVGNNWSIWNLSDCSNLSINFKMSFIQDLCKGKHYDICLAGGEIPEWFSYSGEGSSLSFHLPTVSDGQEHRALLLWVVSTSTNAAASESDDDDNDDQCGMCVAIFRKKSNDMELIETMATVTFDRSSTKHSWIQLIPLIGTEQLQGAEELELNAQIMLHKVEKCGVHVIMQNNNRDSDANEKWGQDIDRQAAGTDIVIPPFHHQPLGSSTTSNDQQLETSLIRELQKWKLSSANKFG